MVSSNRVVVGGQCVHVGDHLPPSAPLLVFMALGKMGDVLLQDDDAAAAAAVLHYPESCTAFDKEQKQN